MLASHSCSNKEYATCEMSKDESKLWRGFVSYSYCISRNTCYVKTLTAAGTQLLLLPTSRPRYLECDWQQAARVRIRSPASTQEIKKCRLRGTGGSHKYSYTLSQDCGCDEYCKLSCFIKPLFSCLVPQFTRIVNYDAIFCMQLQHGCIQTNGIASRHVEDIDGK